MDILRTALDYFATFQLVVLIYSIFMYSLFTLTLNIISSDFLSLNQVNKFCRLINLGDLIAVLGSIDSVLGSVDLFSIASLLCYI